MTTAFLIIGGLCLAGLLLGLFWSPFDYNGGDIAALLMMVGLFVCLIGILVLAAVESAKKKDALLTQCMEDGKKEYECHAMLDSHDHITHMPIIIPMR